MNAIFILSFPNQLSDFIKTRYIRMDITYPVSAICLASLCVITGVIMAIYQINHSLKEETSIVNQPITIFASIGISLGTGLGAVVGLVSQQPTVFLLIGLATGLLLGLGVGIIKDCILSP